MIRKGFAQVAIVRQASRNVALRTETDVTPALALAKMPCGHWVRVYNGAQFNRS